MRISIVLLALGLLCSGANPLPAQLLEVKANKQAIVKERPSGEAPQLAVLPAGSRVLKVDEARLYYSVQLTDGRVGWSYKGNFTVLPNTPPAALVTKETLLARSDVLQIVIIDVEVGDATLILCPREGDRQDVILIDTGEKNDRERIEEIIKQAGFATSGKCLTRLIFTHYDADHIGSAAGLIPLAGIVYDRGDYKVKKSYKKLVTQPGVDRRTMSLSYHETFSGGATLRCVAVNGTTVSTPNATPCADENGRSIALILSYNGFDYFAGGDLNKAAEAPLAASIPRCEVYHMNHHGSEDGSSTQAFVDALHPRVSIASNGTKHGHPRPSVCQYLTGTLGSAVYQTNFNPDDRAYHPDPKFVADDTFISLAKENAEGAKGTIRIIVDPPAGNFYVLVPDVPLGEATFPIDN